MIGHTPDTLTFLHALGVRFSFADPECREIDIETRDISADELHGALCAYGDAIGRHLRARRDLDMMVFVGGPLAGQRYGWCPKGNSIKVGDRYVHRLARKISRARWAMYEIIGYSDPRAWFRGCATSEAKAKNSQLITSDT